MALLDLQRFTGAKHAAEERAAGDGHELVVLHEADSQVGLVELDVEFVTKSGEQAASAEFA